MKRFLAALLALCLIGGSAAFADGTVTVSDAAGLAGAIASGAGEIELAGDIYLDENLTVSGAVSIDGGGHTLMGVLGSAVLTVTGAGSLSLENITVSGGIAAAAVSGETAALRLAGDVETEAAEALLMDGASPAQVDAPGLSRASERITVEQPRYGAVLMGDYLASQGSWVYFTVDCDAGYREYAFTIGNESGDVQIQSVYGGLYRMSFPGGDTELSVELLRVVTPFIDLAPADWFYEAASFAYWNGLMDGVNSYEFAPEAPTTRAMAATVIYRLAGAPYSGSESGFADVPEEAWYAPAVAWAAECGIIEGREDGRFDPGALVTREDFAVMLYRYARYSASAGAGGYSLPAGYYDSGTVSAYAREAVGWACSEGILEGSGGLLRPRQNASRAELAVMLMRFADAV